MRTVTAERDHYRQQVEAAKEQEPVGEVCQQNQDRYFMCLATSYDAIPERGTKLYAIPPIAAGEVPDAQKALDKYLEKFGDLDANEWQDYPTANIFIDGFNAALQLHQDDIENLECELRDLRDRDI